MPTLPHNPSHATSSEPHAPVVLPASYEQAVDEAVYEYEVGAEWLGVSRPPKSELLDLCRKVAALTARVFPGGMSIKVKNDPEITDDIFFVFDVDASGSDEDIAARFDEWHRLLRPAVGLRAELFRLVI